MGGFCGVLNFIIREFRFFLIIRIWKVDIFGNVFYWEKFLDFEDFVVRE